LSATPGAAARFDLVDLTPGEGCTATPRKRSCVLVWTANK